MRTSICKYFLAFSLLNLISVIAFTQSITLDIRNYKVSIESPYHLSLKREAAIGGTTVALLIAGTILNAHKSKIDSATIFNLNSGGILSFDRRALHQYDGSFQMASDILMYSSMATPFLTFVDKRVSGHGAQVITMYFETLGIAGGVEIMAAGSITRYRPLAYNIDSVNGAPVVPLSVKLKKNVTESFYSGHVTASAATAFFAARVFTDFRPQSKLVPFVWGTAVAIPAFTAFARYKAGKHFPSDVAVGYIVGASVGYLVPTLHKIDKKDRISLYPSPNGAGMVYQF